MKLFQKQLFRSLLIRTVLSFKVKLSNPAVDEADPTVVVRLYKAYLKIEAKQEAQAFNTISQLQAFKASAITCTSLLYTSSDNLIC